MIGRLALIAGVAIVAALVLAVPAAITGAVLGFVSMLTIGIQSPDPSLGGAVAMVAFYIGIPAGGCVGLVALVLSIALVACIASAAVIAAGV